MAVKLSLSRLSLQVEVAEGRPRDWVNHRHHCPADRDSSWVATGNCSRCHREYVVVEVVTVVGVVVVVAVPRD